MSEERLIEFAVKLLELRHCTTVDKCVAHKWGALARTFFVGEREIRRVGIDNTEAHLIHATQHSRLRVFDADNARIGILLGGEVANAGAEVAAITIF